MNGGGAKCGETCRRRGDQRAADAVTSIVRLARGNGTGIGNLCHEHETRGKGEWVALHMLHHVTSGAQELYIVKLHTPAMMVPSAAGHMG